MEDTWHGGRDGRQEDCALLHLRGGLSQWKRLEGDRQGPAPLKEGKPGPQEGGEGIKGGCSEEARDE